MCDQLILSGVSCAFEATAWNVLVAKMRSWSRLIWVSYLAECMAKMSKNNSEVPGFCVTLQSL